MTKTIKIMKKPLIYFAIAIVVALVVLAIEKPHYPRVGDTSEKYFIPGFDVAKVMRVEIEQLMDGATLKRDGKTWSVAEVVTPMKKQLVEKGGGEIPEKVFRPADGARVTSALGAFGGLTEGVIVSENPEKQTAFQVDVAGLHVRIFGDNDELIADCIIGKNGPDFMSSYIRRSDENKVYLVNRTLTGFFSTRAEDWVEKKEEAGQVKSQQPK